MGRSHALSGAVAWLGGCALAAGLGARPAVGTVVVGAAVTAGEALFVLIGWTDLPLSSGDAGCGRPHRRSPAGQAFTNTCARG